MLAVALLGCGGGLPAPPGEVTSDAGGGATGMGDGGAQATSTAPEVPPSFVASLVDGMCLPQTLPADANGATTCVVVEALAGGGGESACESGAGLYVPDPATLARVRAESSVSSTTPVCELEQLPPTLPTRASCMAAGAPGWCYLTGAGAGPGCAQTIVFSTLGAPAPGAEVWVVCP